MGELRKFLGACKSEMPGFMNLENGLSAVSAQLANFAHS